MRGLLVFLGCVLPGVAWSADVRLSLGASTEYDNNVFRTPDDEKSDVVFRITPQVRVVEDREKLTYDVGYMLPYEIGVKYSEVRDLNHLAHAGFNYRLTPQTEVFGNNAFFYVRGLYGRDPDIQDPALGGVGDNRERVLTNNLILGTTHHFTPRLSGTLVVNQGVYDTTQFNRANALSYGGTASSAYQLTERHQVGGGFSYARQSFDDTVNRAASDTNYYNLFGSWMWMFDETTRFDVRAGPALIHSNQQAAPATLPNQKPIPFTPVGLALGLPNNDDAIQVLDFLTCPVEGGNSLFFDTGGKTCQARLVVPNTMPTPPPGAVVVPAATITGITSAAPITLEYADTSVPPDGIPDPPGGVTDTRITYFANVGLTKRWTPNLVSSLSYVRQDDTASGIDGGATLDALTFSSAWRISDRWDLSARADWTLRESATEGARQFVTANGQLISLAPLFVAASAQNLIQMEDPNSLDTQRWGTAIRLAYLLTRNTTTALQYTYNRQSSKGDTVGVSSDFDDHLLTFTVQYNFEPIGLWW